MPTMSVSLTNEMAEFVSREVASGDYESPSELMREALRLLRRDRDGEAGKIALLRHKVDQGFAEMAVGDFSELTVSDIAAGVLGSSSK